MSARGWTRVGGREQRVQLRRGEEERKTREVESVVSARAESESGDYLGALLCISSEMEM